MFGFKEIPRAWVCAALGICCMLPGPASAWTLVTLTDPSGLSAEVDFTLLNPTTLKIRAKNTSTGVPSGFSNSDQILTGVSWDFNPPGLGGVTAITGGSVIIGTVSASNGFSTGAYGAGFDVSGEYGFGNGGLSGLLPNFVSTNAAGTTPFGGTNLDGPVSLNGPQGGLIASPPLVPLGGLGAIRDEIFATVTLSQPVPNLNFLGNGVRVEFGSDAAFIHVPEPGALALLLAALLPLTALRWRRAA